MKPIRFLTLPGALTAVLLAGLAMTPALAAQQIEASFETSTRLVPVPATHHSTLQLANCRSCDRVTVQVTPDTRFFIGDEAVTLTELRAYTATRPGLLSCVYYSVPGRKVNRFVVARLEPMTVAELEERAKSGSKRKERGTVK